MPRCALGLALVSAGFMLGCGTWSTRSEPTSASGAGGSNLLTGLGREPTAAEIAAWDIDVRPDGQGLPEGSGDVATGRSIYVAQCERCHGKEGQGVPFDRLVGRIEGDAFPFAEEPKRPRTIGSYWPYATTLFDYVRRAMPEDRPGSLSSDEVYAVSAYLLHLNDLWPESEMLDRRALPQIEMPARSRFVVDDRRGGGEWR